MVGEGQRTLPGVRHVGAGHGSEDRRGVQVRKRVGGNGRPVGLDFVCRDALGVGQVHGGGDAGRGGVARVDGEELHGAALDRGIGTPRALGVLVSVCVAVVDGVGVNQDAERTGELRVVDLDPAIVAAVTDEDNLALDIDAELLEPLEVRGRAVVRVDDIGSDVARRGAAVESGQDAEVILERVAAVPGGVDVLRRGA